MGMPRVQQSVADYLDAAKCGPEAASTEIALIALGKSMQPVDQQNTQLRALDMVIRLTTGYVPTRSAQLHANVKPDQFFDESEFQDAPPIEAAPQEPRNVTPPKGGGSKNGNHRRR
jgi:hypothetical protein